MVNMEQFRDYFTEPARMALEDIFWSTKNGNLTDGEEQELNCRLAEVLSGEAHREQRIRDISPSGKTYLVTSAGGCILVNIYTAMHLFDSPLYFDGEMAIRNIRWMEDDRILQFETHSILHGDVHGYVCHYSPDNNAFVRSVRLNRGHRN